MYLPAVAYSGRQFALPTLAFQIGTLSLPPVAAFVLCLVLPFRISGIEWPFPFRIIAIDWLCLARIGSS